ncbi:ionotropic receptor 75a-like [Megachile rotundata]|uniref:ionotropic receptor 75a-like n=1 Tax=Megachile rotundata TaxID=143995 RepID=UPI003FD31685
MNRVLLLFLQILQFNIIYCTNENHVIRDYFAFRKVERIVGFSCDDMENDFNLAKTLNEKYTTYISMLNSTVESRLDVKQILRAEYHRLGVFLDSRCDSERYAKVIADAGKYFMYDEMHKWLIIGLNLNQTLQILNDDTFSVSTDVVIAIPSLDNYLLYDVYNPCKDRGGSMNVTYFGSWSEKKGLNITLTQTKFQRRSNLHGMKLRVGLVVNIQVENRSLHEAMLEYSMKTKYGRSKFLYILMNHLADLFNFTMDLVEINAQRRFDNSGPVFTAFKRKIIDLSASPVAMKIDRLTNGDIIGPVWPIRSCFMFRTISSTKMKPTQFLQPLSVKVWYVMSAMIIIVTTTLIILIKIEGVSGPAEIYGLSVLLTIGALSQQGSAFVPGRFAGRIAFLHTLIFSVLILNYYSASIVSNRLKNKGEKMNDSLINLSKSNMKLAAEPTPYIRSFLQVPDKEVRYFYENRWAKIPEFNRYLPLEQGLNQVADGSLAYHTMIDSAYPYIEQSFSYRSICELTEVHLFRAILAFYARHRSPFTELMKIGLTKIRNTGIQSRELKRWGSRKPFCPTNLLIAEPLSIHEAAPVFIFLSFAIILSLLFCAVENIVYCLSPSRKTSAIMEKRHLIASNLDLSSMRDLNLQTLQSLTVVEE